MSVLLHCSALISLHRTQNEKLEVWQYPLRFSMIWSHSPTLLSPPMLAVSPSLTHSGHTSFLVLPFPSQAYSCLSASAHAVSSVWNTFPRLSPRLTPSICSGLCSDVYHRGFPRSLFKRDTAPTHDTLQYPYPVSPFLPWHYHPWWLLIYAFVHGLPPSTRMQAPWGKKWFLYPLLHSRYQK